MRILHIASGNFFSTYGGGQVYVKNLVDTMIHHGMDIAVVSLISCNEGIVEKIYNGARLIEINSPAYIEEATGRIKPSLIHAHSLKDLVCEVGSKNNIPVVVTAHHGGILCPAGTRLNCYDKICKSRVNHQDCLPCVLRNIPTGLRCWYPFMRHLSLKRYIRFGNILTNIPHMPFITPVGKAALHIEHKKKQFETIATHCTMMIAPCEEIADAMILNGLSESRIKVISHGIPLPKVRAEYPEISDGIIKFYYVGRICFIKGIHVLLKAFGLVDNAKIELHLIGGAGNKQEQRYMSKMQGRFRLDKRIIWHGKIKPEEIYECSKNFHVSITASFLEAFGLNIAESLALGKPVLSTKNGGGEMQIKEGYNGWLVPTNDVKALSEKINYVASHPEILAEMSKNCHAIAIDDHCNSLYGVYKKAIEIKNEKDSD